MSLHKLYCAVCFKQVEVELAGRPHDFMDWQIKCPCEQDESVVIKNISCYGYRDMPCDIFHKYGLFNICDLVPSVEIVQDILKKQGEPLMEFVG